MPGRIVRNMSFYLIPAASYQRQQKLKEQAEGRTRHRRPRSSESTRSTISCGSSTRSSPSKNQSRRSSTDESLHETVYTDRDSVERYKYSIFDQESFRSIPEDESVSSAGSAREKRSVYNYSSNVELATALTKSRHKNKKQNEEVNKQLKAQLKALDISGSDIKGYTNEGAELCEITWEEEDDEPIGGELTRVYSDISSVFSTRYPPGYRNVKKKADETNTKSSRLSKLKGKFT